MNRNALVCAVLSVCLVSGCGAGKASYSSAPAAPSAAPAAGAAPAPIDRSLFARDPEGQLSEEKLQEILERPLELDLPARVGVMPIVSAEDWRGPGPSYDMVPAGLQVFADKLPSSEAFTLVTEMIPIPSGALGMEALREAAARYKLRYLVLYREHVSRRQRANAWAVGYATVVGALFLPGSTLEVDGYVEASLFDVKTGLLMFTVRRRVTARQTSNVWHKDHKLGRLQRKLATRAGQELAKDARRALFRYRAAVKVENQRMVARAQEGAPLPAPRTPVLHGPTSAHTGGTRSPTGPGSRGTQTAPAQP